jgi:hypothetical protein
MRLGADDEIRPARVPTAEADKARSVPRCSFRSHGPITYGYSGNDSVGVATEISSQLSPPAQQA